MESLPSVTPEPPRAFFTSEAEAIRGDQPRQLYLRAKRIKCYDSVLGVVSNDWLRVAALLEKEGAGEADTDARELLAEGLDLIHAINHDDMIEPDPHRERDHGDKVPYMQDTFKRAGQVDVFVKNANREIDIIVDLKSMRDDVDFVLASHIIELENAVRS